MTNTTLSPLLLRARTFAEKAHGTQLYGDGAPYVTHLDAVHAVAAEHGLPEPVQVAAFLHDVLEDTPVQPTELADEFGLEVVVLVQAVTGYGKDRPEKVQDAYTKIIAIGRDAAALKLCDRIANVEAARRDSRTTREAQKRLGYLLVYQREQEGFVKMLHKAMPLPWDAEIRALDARLTAAVAWP